MATKQQLRAHFDAQDARVAAFMARLEKVLGELIGDAVAGLETGDVTGAEAAQVLGSLQSILSRGGLAKEFGRLRAIYAEELKFIASEFKALGIKTFTDTDKALVNTLIDFEMSRVSNELRAYTGDVQAVMMRGVLVGDVPKFRDLQEELGARTVAQLTTEVKTGLAGFNRTVTVSKAVSAGFKLFLYLGPDDQITRPFCSKVLSKDPAIYTYEEILEMDNDRGLPVIQYGGGYNCRHEWLPIEEEEAVRRGWESK